MIEDAMERAQSLKEKATNYVNQLKSTERNLKDVLEGGDYPIQSVNFFERNFRVFVGKEKIQEIRIRLDKEDKSLSGRLGTENFEIEYSGLELEFDEDMGDVIVHVPVWDGAKTVFEAAQKFQAECNCQITDSEGYLDEKINDFERRMKKHQQLKKDIS